jgi:lincosamide nucleotidyltransferase B/F
VKGEVLSKEALLGRLDAIAEAALKQGHVLAVLALGSSGMEQERIDRYSDLDVWIIIEEGYREHILGDLGWLNAVCPIVYKSRHSASGYRLLFEDGIFSELDAFEVADLASIPFAEARIVWKAEGMPETLGVPQLAHARDVRSTEAMLGEALGNIYVGLGRFYRGEKLSAMRFIQVYALDQVLKLASLVEEEQAARRDLFSVERRFEKRFPGIAADLPAMAPGYDRTPEAALAILQYLDRHFQIEPAMKQAILARLSERPSQ